MAELESILQFLDETFSVREFPDYPHALNGLQVEGPAEVRKVAAAVDAAEATILGAVDRESDLLVVHHGLFWGGLGSLTGPAFRKVAALIRGKVGLYSLHLPLDAHGEMGNNALLLKALGLEPQGPFGSFKEVQVGWWSSASLTREELGERLESIVGGEVRVIPGGPESVRRLGVVSGGGASTLKEAAFLGLDTVITGEAPHHAYHEALELGVNLLLGGHYATETLGVQAVADGLATRFDVAWEFIHHPTGL